MKTINVLSLFDGMSCGRIALERAGIPVNKYYASEIDKYAIQVANKNYPSTIQLGDVTKWREWNIDFSSIDLIFAGFPCQAWSVAGKQKGDNDPRGALVHDLIAIWNKVKEVNPDVKFLFENVKMKKEFLDYISNDLFVVEPVRINSNLVSAQNRDRYYWCSAGHVPQPDDTGLVLADIIEEGIVDRDKSHCIDANYFKGGNLKTYFDKSRRQLIFQRGRGFNKGGFKAINGKTPSLTPSSWEQNNFLSTVEGFRKLTPLECERLQTLPDGYTKGVSNTQRYKMIGNGWTVDVIAHILKQMDFK